MTGRGVFVLAFWIAFDCHGRLSAISAGAMIQNSVPDNTDSFSPGYLAEM